MTPTMSRSVPSYRRGDVITPTRSRPLCVERSDRALEWSRPEYKRPQPVRINPDVRSVRTQQSQTSMQAQPHQYGEGVQNETGNRNPYDTVTPRPQHAVPLTSRSSHMQRSLETASDQPKKHTRRSFMWLFQCTVPITIMAVGGFLAYDTWVTNREVEAKMTATPVSSTHQEATPASQKDTKKEQKPTAPVVPAGVPATIDIKSIGVSASIMSLGLAADRSIAAPTDDVRAGWYTGSAQLGQPGTVFIDGHYGTHASKGVFYDLARASYGEIITIKDGAGKSFDYSIVSTKTVNVQNVDMAEALRSGNVSTHGLTIITCAGTYNVGENSYNQRTIVYAKYVQ